MTIANFDIIIFNEQIGDEEGEIDVPWYVYVGDQTTKRTFNIPGVPTGNGYIIVQVYDVQNKGHKIIINGEDLPGEDIIRTRENQWQDVTDVIPEGILRQGRNTIQIVGAKSGDNIMIGAVIINWKEFD
ncbi:MAG: hypothetical protein JSW00_13520 [Thermoplasmata archaeon]|nr:MAG: hypothetical protein JSW00_13520 [Thermoplasmata archaeon]